MRVVFFILLFIMLFSVPAYAAENDTMLDILPLDNVSTVIGASANTALYGLDFKALVWQAVRGELTLTPQLITQSLLQGLLGETATLFSMLRHMLVIAVIGAVFREISAAFKHKAAAEIGFYAQYLAILSVLLSSYTMCLGVMQNLIDELCSFMIAAQPVLCSVAVIGGNPSAAMTSAPILLATVNTVSIGIRNVVIPVITVTAVLQIVNSLSERVMLTKLSALLSDGVKWTLRVAAGLFVGMLSFRRIAAPALDTAITRTAKLAVNAIPVVGTALSGAVDMVTTWSGVVKGGLTAATLVVLVLYCAAPILRLVAFTLLYKLTAGLMQPIADPRAVKAVDAAGDFAGMILGVCSMISAMFMVMAALILSM